MTDSPIPKGKILEDLQQPFDTNPQTNKRVKQRPGGQGKMLSYITGWDAIATANKIFGEDGWRSRIVKDPVRVTIGDESFYWCIVEVQAVGFQAHSDVGYGRVGKGFDAERRAITTSRTDAMKRALRHYGPQFGNSLYGKDDVDSEFDESFGDEQPAAQTAQNQPQGNVPAQPATNVPPPQPVQPSGASCATPGCPRQPGTYVSRNTGLRTYYKRCKECKAENDARYADRQQQYSQPATQPAQPAAQPAQPAQPEGMPEGWN